MRGMKVFWKALYSMFDDPPEKERLNSISNALWIYLDLQRFKIVYLLIGKEYQGGSVPYG